MARRHRSAAQRRATARLVAFNKRKRASRKRAARKAAATRRRIRTAPRKRRRRASASVTPKRRVRHMAKRRHHGGRRHRGRRRGGSVIKFRRIGGSVYHRNPGFSVRGIFGTLKTAVPRAVTVVAGKAATRLVANLLPLPKEGVMNTVTQVASALLVGIAAKMVVPRFADDLVVGGIVAPIESLAKGLPVIGPALGDDDLVLGDYYLPPQVPAGQVGEVGEDIGEYEIV